MAIKADGRGGDGDYALGMPYYKHGVFTGGDFRASSELRKPGYKWFPDPGRGHWVRCYGCVRDVRGVWCVRRPVPRGLGLSFYRLQFSLSLSLVI